MKESVLSRLPTGDKRVCVFKMADSSLDDIIKQKRVQKFGKVNQNNQNKNTLKGNRQVGKPMMNRGRLFKDVQKDLGITAKQNQISITTDARNRIIQKQRVKFHDARDRLAQIAKQGDARDKLNLIRETNPTQIRRINPMVKKAIPQQKAAVVQKKIINIPKNTFNAGQTRMRGAAVVRTVSGAGQIRPAFKKTTIIKVNPRMVKKAPLMTRTQRVGQIQKTGRQFNMRNTVPARRNNMGQVFTGNAAYATDVTDFRKDLQFVQRNQSFSGMGVPTAMDTVLTRQEPLIRTHPVDTVVYDTQYEPEVLPSRLRITAANSNFRFGNQLNAQHQAWNPPARIQPARDMYDDQVEYQVYPQKIATMPAARAPVDRGTKVVVSNLHPCVSIEDMEELFGTVGPILSVNMLRQGVAEALFVNQEDAYRSVDLFNNRQLDGQPMKVVVVRQKTPLMTTSSVQSRSVLKSARGRTGYYM